MLSIIYIYIWNLFSSHDIELNQYQKLLQKHSELLARVLVFWKYSSSLFLITTLIIIQRTVFAFLPEID